MKKLNLFLIIVAFLLGNHFLFSQAVDRLYLSSASTGRVYDITSLTGGALPTPITIPNSSRTPLNISNLAVGYDQPGGNPSTLVFINSNTAAGSTLFKNGTAISGTTIPGVVIGGIATNNVPGPYFGNVYGFQSNTKTLYPIYPSGTAIPITSTDTDWNNGTTFGTDTFFDYQNNIYTFINNGSNRYLFKISIATGVAEKAISAPISGSASFANLPTSRGIQGMAYLQGFVYIASVNNNNNIEIRRININDGTSILSATYTSSSSSNLDLATVPYYAPFTLTCSGITQSPTTPFVEGVASNGVRSLNIPITNVYGPGTYTINITGANFNSSSTVNITSSTTSINVPLVYDGGGSSGTRTLSVNLNGSTTACSVNVVVEKDTDKDSIPDYQDLDSDNDGILDAVEMYCDQTIAPNGTFPVSNGPATTPAYSNQLLFFDWNGVTLSNASPTATKSVVYNGVTYTATISNYTSVGTGTPNAMVGNDILTWSGPSQMVGRYYNVNSTTFKEALYIPSTGFTGVNSFNISVTASKDGVAYPVDFVFFDAETTNKSATQTEQIKFTNNTAGTIELLEKTGTGTIGATTDGVVNITGIGTNTVTLNETETSNVNALLFVKGYSPSVKVDITTSLGSQQGVGFAVRLNCDTDNDGTPNYLDTDSDGDGCPDAIEGGDNITQTMLNGSNAIGSNISGTLNSPAIATVDANGVPVITNTGSTFNVDGQAQGQTAGSSANASVNGCYCYKPAQTTGTALDTNHGITALGRAGADNSNWPMVRKGAWTVLEAKTKGFVVNRLTDAQISAIPSADLREGMMVYNITQDCLQINIDGTATGWKCFNTQTCPDL